MSKEVNVQVGPGLFGLTFLILLVAKVFGFITWSWWFITAPLWAPFAIVLLGFVVFAIMKLII